MQGLSEAQIFRDSTLKRLPSGCIIQNIANDLDQRLHFVRGNARVLEDAFLVRASLVVNHRLVLDVFYLLDRQIVCLEQFLQVLNQYLVFKALGDIPNLQCLFRLVEDLRQGQESERLRTPYRHM